MCQLPVSWLWPKFARQGTHYLINNVTVIFSVHSYQIANSLNKPTLLTYKRRNDIYHKFTFLIYIYTKYESLPYATAHRCVIAIAY